MGNLLIVDGSNLLFQMFYGMPAPIFSKSGKPVHATIGFVSALLRMLRMREAGEALVVFDSDTSSLRREILPSYKANRPDEWDTLPPEEVPFTQEDDIKRCLGYLGVGVVSAEGVEADDVIAALVGRNRQRCRITVSSFDSDFFQLIGDGVSVLRYRGDKSVLWDRDYFVSRFSFPPEFYPLWKAIAGDKSDNIPGVPSFGPKRAAMCVRNHMEGRSLGDGLSPRLGALLEENLRTVERNLSLIALSDNTSIVLPPGPYTYSLERAGEGNTRVLTLCGIFD